MIAVRYDGATVGGGDTGGQGETRAQPRADQEVGAETRVAPQIRHSTGTGLLLLMVQMNVVCGHIGDLRRHEIELRRGEILALRALRGEVKIRAEVLHGVVRREFDAVLLAIAVVERRQDDGRPELTLVDQIDRLLIVSIDAQGQRTEYLLLDTQVV